MLRSLFAGISGLRQHQTMMDVTGNNIANVNTAGFKTSSVVFQDTLSQMLKAAGSPQGDAGGTNPGQIGLGVKLGGISTNFAQGSAQTTGRATDLMIQGDGFFAVRSGGEQLYTRAGSFNFDASGKLVTPEGAVVQGWMGAAGAINVNGPVGDIQLPMGKLLPPTATGAGVVGGNLPAGLATGESVSTSITMYDDLGNKRDIEYLFTKAAGNNWTMAVREGATTLSTQALAFNGLGAMTTPNPPTVTFNAGWGPISAEIGGITQYSGGSTVAALEQDGAPMGSLQAFTMSPDGTVVGVFSNGMKQKLAQVAVGNFTNPPGLEKVGGSMYRSTVNSGLVQMGVAGNGGRGQLASGQLEMSNVDLASEFTNLIVAQRGFQANSKIISSSDEVLQDLVNLKR
jgi:flagellar hook protein FlgE